MFNEVGLDLMASVRILVLPLTNLLIHMQRTPSEPQFSSSAHLSGLLGPGKESVPCTGQLSLYCNGVPRLGARLVRHGPCSGSGVSLLVNSSGAPCSLSSSQSCPASPVLRGARERSWKAAWRRPGLKGGKDLGIRGARGVEKRFAGKNEQEGGSGSQPVGKGRERRVGHDGSQYLLSLFLLTIWAPLLIRG